MILDDEYPKKFRIILELRGPADAGVEEARKIVKQVCSAFNIISIEEIQEKPSAIRTEA